MGSNRIGSIATAALLCLNGPALAEVPVVAVFEIQDDGGGLTPAEREALTGYLGAELAASGRFQVVPSAELKAALSAKKKESYET